MIISHKNKFIFIKNPKTAGSTCEYLLRKACGPKDIITRISEESNRMYNDYFPKELKSRNYNLPLKTVSNKRILLNTIQFKSPYQNKFFNHDPAKKIKGELGDKIWNSYFKFCFERHPVTKLISKYKWMYYNKKIRDKCFLSFDSFIRTGMFASRGYDLYSIGGISQMDKIFKYEKLNDSFEYLSDKFNVQMKPNSVKFKNSKTFAFKPDDNSIKINKEHLKIIEIAFARELKLLEYDLEDFDEKYKDF